MGKAKQCDRCKGFYPYSTKWYDGEVACLKTVSVSPLSHYSTGETYWDLCPDCTAELNQWLKGKDFKED